jgi:hypothetical protein
MKLLIVTALTLSLLAPPTLFAAETKKVCVEQTDPKTKKPKQVCKDVKVHKKLEGTKVPDKQAK